MEWVSWIERGVYVGKIVKIGSRSHFENELTKPSYPMMTAFHLKKIVLCA